MINVLQEFKKTIPICNCHCRECCKCDIPIHYISVSKQLKAMMKQDSDWKELNRIATSMHIPGTIGVFVKIQDSAELHQMLNLYKKLSIEESIINLLSYSARKGFNIRKISISKDDYNTLCETTNNAVNTEYCVILASVGNCVIEKGN